MPSTLSTYSNNKVGLRLELTISEDQNVCVEPGVPTAFSRTDSVLFPLAKLSCAKPVISQVNVPAGFDKPSVLRVSSVIEHAGLLFQVMDASSTEAHA